MEVPRHAGPTSQGEATEFTATRGRDKASSAPKMYKKLMIIELVRLFNARRFAPKVVGRPD
jgi:hypothetical protein